MAAWIDEAVLHVVQGELQEWTRHTPSGKQMVCRFCGVCGSRLFHQVLGSRYLSIKPGSLDDPSQYQPVAHIWVASKQPSVEIPLGQIQFEGNPDSMDSLMQAWKLAHT
jgi:hypothetical protein